MQEAYKSRKKKLVKTSEKSIVKKNESDKITCDFLYSTFVYISSSLSSRTSL